VQLHELQRLADAAPDLGLLDAAALEPEPDVALDGEVRNRA
jgi:hypothetical protein